MHGDCGITRLELTAAHGRAVRPSETFSGFAERPPRIRNRRRAGRCPQKREHAEKVATLKFPGGGLGGVPCLPEYMRTLQATPNQPRSSVARIGILLARCAWTVDGIRKPPLQQSTSPAAFPLRKEGLSMTRRTLITLAACLLLGVVTMRDARSGTRRRSPRFPSGKALELAEAELKNPDAGVSSALALRSRIHSRAATETPLSSGGKKCGSPWVPTRSRGKAKAFNTEHSAAISAGRPVRRRNQPGASRTSRRGPDSANILRPNISKPWSSWIPRKA